MLRIVEENGKHIPSNNEQIIKQIVNKVFEYFFASLIFPAPYFLAIIIAPPEAIPPPREDIKFFI